MYIYQLLFEIAGEEGFKLQQTITLKKQEIKLYF